MCKYNYVTISIPRVPFTNMGLTLIPVWMRDYNHYKLWYDVKPQRYNRKRLGMEK